VRSRVWLVLLALENTQGQGILWGQPWGRRPGPDGGPVAPSSLGEWG